jgi:hypothetical protein
MKRPLLLGFLLVVTVALPIHALIVTGEKQPVGDPGWPDGAARIADLPSRIFYAEGPPFGGGQWTFFHTGDTAALQTTLDAFARIKSADHIVRLYLGHPTIPYPVGTNATQEVRYDWSFMVWRSDLSKLLPDSNLFPMPRGYREANPPALPLVLDVWVHPGGPDWAAITVPKEVKISDERRRTPGAQDKRL